MFICSSRQKRLRNERYNGITQHVNGHATNKMTARLPSVDDAIYAIRAYKAASESSIYSLAKRSGIAQTTIVDIDRPEWNPTAITLRVLHSIIPPDFDPSAAFVPKLDGSPPMRSPRALPKPTKEESDAKRSPEESTGLGPRSFR